MVDVCNEELVNGNIVRIGDMGSLRVSISGVPTQEEVTSSLIKKGKILFTPGPLLVNMLKVLNYQKV